MADISKISPDGGATEYNIKDATARTDVSTINGKIPSGASSSNKMATASDIAGIYSANAVTGVHNLANFVQDKGVNTSGEVVDTSGRIATVNPIPIESGKQYKVVSTATSAPSFIYAVWNGNTLVRREAGVNPDTILDTSGGNKLYVCAYRSESITISAAKAMVIFADDFDTSYRDYAMTNEELTDAVAYSEGSFTDNVAGSTFEVNTLQKFGRVVVARFMLSGVTANAWTAIASIPEGFRPGTRFVRSINLSKNTTYLEANGSIIQCSGALNNENAHAFFTWITA